MHLKEPIKDDAGPSVSPILVGSKGAKAASSPFRYALPMDNKADEIASVSLSRRRRDVGVKVQLGRSEGGGGRELRDGDDDDASHGRLCRAFPAVTACARVFPRDCDPIPRSRSRPRKRHPERLHVVEYEKPENTSELLSFKAKSVKLKIIFFKKDKRRNLWVIDTSRLREVFDFS